MSQKLPYSFWKNGMYFYEFRIGPFNNGPCYGQSRALYKFNFFLKFSLALKPFMHKNYFRKRVDLRDAADANLILAAQNDH